MRGRRLVLVSCIGLWTACGSDDPSFAGSGSGAGAASVEEPRQTSLSTLRLTSELAVQGTITSVAADPAGSTVSMNVVQTLLSTAGSRPTTVRFVTAPDDGAVHASLEGEDAIVFLVWSSGKYVINGSATGYFRVADGVVTPIVDDGVSLPANTDVPSFIEQLGTAPPPPVPGPGYDYTGGMGGGY